ncbi:receptor-like cytosolic serine/threonine-protein kinase RBK1 isoform X1 [Olea europaea var. sylvestris]|uniref:receptor-like cytosolic serine/threonine-protein kinase RBK1 isoform X1 n=1 Tax=Olea europaea var. sylvestris TaxID=158386 RepID=UPI000C1D81AE|nr:receptor-like cytosolic serine/threonine-protein kinase RBK1 isoform X1 [Olea europaea var. sylvestris]
MEGKTVLENQKIEEMEEESNLLVKQDEKNSDSESLENVKNEEQGTETEKKEEEMEEEQSSPRGVLEIPISGSDSDHSSRSSSLERTSSFCSEKSFLQRGISGELGYGLQWKNLLGQIKKRTSVRRLTTIPLLGGYDFSKKSLRGKLGRNRSTEDTINCGDVVVPKPSWRNFTYDELKQATDNFSPDKLLGKGGHAEVYKGCLSDGQIVAVKKITKKKKNDEDRVGDFLSELGIIAHIDHPNAARLIGFSADNDLHLVLQFSPHGSLATVLHGGSEVSLEWKIRYKVAVGVAEGLQYLHYDCQRRIIHRDITASNILLSEDYEAQISDFGLAKWLPQKWAHHVVSPIEGTFGYMAPEYFMHGMVHEKTDVFAFGVLLLELITGRRAVDSCRQSLVMWAKPLLEKNNVKELTDPKLGNNYNVIEMKRSIFAASTCLHHLPNMRPNMKKVVQILGGENEPVDMKQKSMGGRALMVDACDLDDYTATTYLKDLNRHMELVME